MLWCMAQASLANQLELRHAHVSVTVGQQTREQDITLPYHWDRHNPGQPGKAEFQFVFDLPSANRDPWALYIPKLGNAYEVWLNGMLIERQGDMALFNGADHSQMPHFVPISPGELQTSNHLVVRIRADVGRRGGLSRLLIGPQEEVHPVYRSKHFLHGTLSLMIAMFSLVVGLLALALWASQNNNQQSGWLNRDPLYLYAGLAEFFWAFGVGYAMFEDPPLPWPWWGLLPMMALGIWCCAMVLFCIEVAGWRDRPGVAGFRRGILTTLATGPLLGSWALAGGQPLALTLWYAAMGLAFSGFAVVFLRQALKASTWGHRMVAVAMMLNLVVGLRDLYVFRIEQDYAQITYLRFSSVLFGLTLAAIVITRFRQAQAQARELMTTMAQRISDKERELQHSFDQLELLAREQASAAERTRILRDMHDGVGSHISSAIRQLQSGQADPDELLQTLRDSLDQLKLSIDAMNLPPGDVTSLLANLRYRLEPRFAASGIELQWEVSELPHHPGLDTPAMRQLQFMVFEALSNVLQHAQAHRLTIEARPQEQGFRMRIIDDGRGFDTALPRRKGLQSMQERAQAIGARLSLQSRPGQTVVEITLDGTSGKTA